MTSIRIVIIVPAAELVVVILPAGMHAFDAGFASFPINQFVWNLIEELTGHHVAGLPPLRAYGRACHIQASLRASDAT